MDGGRAAQDWLQHVFLESPPWFAGQRNQPHCSLQERDEHHTPQFGLCCCHQHELTPLPVPPLQPHSP